MSVMNIVRAVVKPGTTCTVTKPIMKEHKGQILLIEGLDLPEIYEIDFSNDRHRGSSVTMIGNADGVLIPTQFIKTGKDVYAFYYYVGDGFGQTEHIFKIPNDFRPDRTDEEPEPEQQSTIDQAIAAVNEAVVKTEENKTAAKNSADSAKDDADRAERARDAAEEHAQNASRSASNAGTSEQNARAYSESAERSKNEAKGYAEDAEESANLASTSERNAQRYSNSASGSANQAAMSERNAANSAAEAGRKSELAATKANEASDYADTASHKASEASESASQASGSATEAEQAKGASQTAQGLAESARDSAITAKNEAEAARDRTQTLVDGISGKVEQIDQNTADISVLQDHDKSILDAFPTKTVETDDSITFEDGAGNIPLKSFVIDFSPIQEGEGDPSPDNIRPIRGFMGVNITQTGKNLRGGIALANDIKERISSAVIDTAEKTVSWEYNAVHGEAFAPKVPFKENTQYTFIITVQNASKRLNFRIYYADGTVQALPDLTTADKVTLAIATLSNKTVKTIVRQAQGGTTKLYYDESGIFEGVLAADDFEPFGQVISFDWESEAGTVYGGTLDVLSGVLTIDMATGDMGSLSWTVQGDAGKCYSIGMRGIIKHGTSSKGYDNVFADIYSAINVSSIGSLKPNTMSVDSSANVMLYDPRFAGMTGAQIKAELQGVTMCYKLATPITVQLTPHDVRTLLELNHIWTDAGHISVEYRADPEIYIADQNEKNSVRIASLEDDRYEPYATDAVNGRITLFVDGANDIPLKSLTITLEPQQDLHGYDTPWIGGAGKNLLDPTLLKDQVAWNIIPIYAPVGTVFTMSTNQPGAATSGLLTYFRTPGGTQGSNENVLNTHSATKTVGEEGYLEIVQRNRDNIKSYADYEYQIEVGETATEYEPYENICPITGHSGFNLYRTGGNLITKEFPDDAFLGQFSTGSTSIASASVLKCFMIYVGKNAKIIYIKDSGSPDLVCAFADEYSNTRADVVLYNAINVSNRNNYVWDSDDHPYMVLNFSAANMEGNIPEKYGMRLHFYDGVKYPFFPRGTIDKYSYDWTEEAGIVYGCVVDVLTGVLTITHQMKTFDGTEEWKVTNDRFYVNMSLTDYVVDSTEWISNLYPFGGYRTQPSLMGTDKRFYTNYNSGSATKERVFIADSSFADVDSLKAFLAVKPLTVCGPLATPIEIQLEPHELASILGGNQIWTDNGTIDVEYRADTKRYIERLTAPDSEDMIADANITSGQYFMVGTTLYKATANIANGGQIIVGTNCTRVSLSEALNEINA